VNALVIVGVMVMVSVNVLVNAFVRDGVMVTVSVSV